MEASWRAIYWAREILVCSGSVGPWLESAWEGGRGTGVAEPNQNRDPTVLGLREALLQGQSSPQCDPCLQGGDNGDNWGLQRWHPWLSHFPT